jgi:hypothetical protein
MGKASVPPAPLISAENDSKERIKAKIQIKNLNFDLFISRLTVFEIRFVFIKRGNI